MHCIYTLGLLSGNNGNTHMRCTNSLRIHATLTFTVFWQLATLFCWLSLNLGSSSTIQERRHSKRINNMDTEHQAVNSLDHIWYPTRDYNWNTCTAGPNTKTFGPPVRAAVYLPGQKRHFTDLPVELILAIACATDKPTDAARLLCTSRALHQIWETHLRYLTTNILRKCSYTR